MRCLKLLLVGAAVTLLSLAQAVPAQARPVLILASPPADTAVTELPQRVTLTFDCLLSDRGAAIAVLNEAGERVDLRDGHVDPANRFTLVASLPPLPEGRYQVSYSASALGGSTLIASGYSFTIDLPDPILQMLSPVNGQAFQLGPIPLRTQVSFFDLSQEANRIRLYLDGQLAAELHTLEFPIEGLEPGVHQVRTVLVRGDGEELPGTSNTVYIAVARPDVETLGRELAAVAPPDPGLRLTFEQWVAVGVGTVLLLALGVVIGRSHG